MKALIAAALMLAAPQQQQPQSPYAPWAKGPPTDPDFFPIAVWVQAPANAAKYRDAGINTFVALHRGPTAEHLDALKAAGMKAVCHQNAAGLARKDDPTIIAWMHGDEPDNAQGKPGGGYGPPVLPEKIVERYKAMREADPTRPVFLNLGQGVAWDKYIGRGVRTNHPEDYPEYVKGCDIASFDIYPAVHDSPEIAGKLWYVPLGVERLRKAGEGKKIVWNCIEASRISNVNVKPTAAQIRAEVWMSLIHGSVGIVYFVHQFEPNFIEASILRDPELLRGVTEINRQVRSLARPLNSPTVAEAATVATSDPAAPVAFVVKREGGATYLFSAAMREKPSKAVFTFREIRSGAAEVLGENRTVAVREGKLEDEFKPYEIHLYRITSAPK